MELKTETATLEISSEVCRSENSFSAESDLIVPDNMPDILSILQISANAATSSCDPQSDRVLLTGKVFFNILYVADTPRREVRAINTGAVFSNIFSTPGVRDTMPIVSEVSVGSISYDLANCRKLSVRSELTGRATVYSNSQLTLPISIEGAEVRTAPVSCYVIKARGIAQETVTESFTLSPDKKSASEILRDEVMVTEYSIKIIRNKAIVKGTLDASVLYSCESGIQRVKSEIPFTKVVNADGLEEDMTVDCSIDVQGWETELNADDNGEKRIIDIETMLYFTVLGKSVQSCNAIIDAYYPGAKLICEKQTVAMSNSAPGVAEECAIKGTIRLPDAMGEIETVLDIGGSSRIIKVYNEGDDVIAEGTATVSILFSTLNPEVPTASYSYDIDFRHTLGCARLDPLPQIKAELKNMNYSVSGGNTIDIRGMASLYAVASSSCEQTLVTKVTLEKDESEKKPSILISYITQDKTLWEIAKSYNVSRANLLAANDIKTEDELKSRRALVIPG